MKVQRLIEKYKKLEGVWDAEGAELARQIFLQDLEQLDEPETVKVPQCVADWYEVCKEHLTTSLYTAMNPNFMRENNQSFDLISWIKKTSNQDLFARAWLDGYEVEEEKRYRVKMKNIIIDSAYLKHQLQDNHWYWGSLTESNEFSSSHTKNELEEAGVGWVFDCEGIEVEEVKG